MLLVVEHDNGILGQHGFSDHDIKSESEVANIIYSYAKAGCTVYNYFVTEN
jgi:hypothetical protein